MKPLYIVLTINLSFFAVWALIFFFVVEKPQLIPLFVGFQTIVNGLLGVISLADRKKSIAVAFLVGFLMCGAIAVVGFIYLFDHRDEIQGAEFAQYIQALSQRLGLHV